MSLEQRRISRYVLWIIGVCVVTSHALGTNDIQSYLRTLDISPDHVDPDEGSWGLDDVTATAGKVFKLVLPDTIYRDGVTHVKIVEKGQTDLPHWLEMTDADHYLSGVPTVNEIGKQIYLEVTPVSKLTNTSLNTDIFSIKVIEDPVHAETTAVPLKNVKHDEELRPIKCAHDSSVTMASIMVDTDMSILLPRQRVSMLENMCRHLGMPTDIVRLSSLGNKPMFDSMALVAGPGDVKRPMYSGAMVTWEVGCGNVFANHMPVLQQLENTAHDGTMAKAVGHGIIGWHVTNNKPMAAKRIKRRAVYHATRTPDIMPPMPTKHAGGDATEEPGVPPSRHVPTMATPEFPEIKPTQSEPHHHHHTRGPKTHGRHPDHHPSSAEPTHSKHKPIMATPSVVPIMPTKVEQVPSATAEPTGGLIQPSVVPSSPGVSRSEVLIEPSMTPVVVKPTGGATDVLPTRTYLMPSASSAEPIKPTATDGFTPPTKVPPIMSTTEPVTKKPMRTTRPPKVTASPKITPPPEITPPPPTEALINYKPVVKDGGLDRIDVAVGDILDFQIPENNFEDYEDGNTRNLKLTLMTFDNMDLTPDSWVILDQKTQRIYALPLPEHVGRNEFLLAAFDSGTKSARDAFEIYVRMRPGEQRINHEMSMSLNLNYHQFLLDVHQRVDVAKKLAGAFGDSDMSNIAVTKLAPGSVQYSWTNKSVPTDQCPEGTLLKLTNTLITPDGEVNPEFRESMEPYGVNNVEADFKGSCSHMQSISTKPQAPVAPEPGDDDWVGVEPKKTSEEDVLVTTVAPAVVIAAMLLLGAIIACILYRKRRKGKLSDEDQHTFLQKGVPIILPDELDDKPDPPTKPLIMDDEKPPQPPPEYPRSPSPSTPRSTHKEPLIDTDDELDNHHSPLYRPPPPPATGSLGGRNSRPRTPLSQRSPPQYMSPISP